MGEVWKDLLLLDRHFGLNRVSRSGIALHVRLSVCVLWRVGVVTCGALILKDERRKNGPDLRKLSDVRNLHLVYCG